MQQEKGGMKNRRKGKLRSSDGFNANQATARPIEHN